MNQIVLIGDARSYHVVDWYKTIKYISNNKNISVKLFSDLFESENHNRLIKKFSDDPIFTIDCLMLNKQSKISDRYRNLIKFAAVPFQSWQIRKFWIKRNKNGIVFHAHSFYYILICAIARVPFVATPMGSDYLVRPRQSIIYKYLSKFSVKGAKAVTVDSNLLKIILETDFSVKNIFIIQNGIDVQSILNLCSSNKFNKSDRLLSIRALTELYQINKFLIARNNSNKKYNIDFVYPFLHEDYLNKIHSNLINGDIIVGRVDKITLYNYMSNSLAVISVPSSDSSPRSVYEAIFCGAKVITTQLEWIDLLTENMKKSVYIIGEINHSNLNKILHDISKSDNKFIPNEHDIASFDQFKQMEFLINNIYPKVFK
ncbi:glycosyltransferase [Polynucleobacter sp. MWH-Spelu-300-X4]|uniref:glycosyltransferase n=1 Tax=Polynucleobacter sp. MWH-Spelu-300-X4 TaxID=2689109 RepID=UPI001BFE125A|nr:glycosyltransferase [Polynucleobacter sp. MWH-Spelu-300-X4]QWD80047.1 glycosyltransferase [Polynucleobacter sp. MWH-Spelu-300-X4]